MYIVFLPTQPTRRGAEDVSPPVGEPKTSPLQPGSKHMLPSIPEKAGKQTPSFSDLVKQGFTGSSRATRRGRRVSVRPLAVRAAAASLRPFAPLTVGVPPLLTARCVSLAVRASRSNSAKGNARGSRGKTKGLPLDPLKEEGL